MWFLGLNKQFRDTSRCSVITGQEQWMLVTVNYGMKMLRNMEMMESIWGMILLKVISISGVVRIPKIRWIPRASQRRKISSSNWRNSDKKTRSTVEDSAIGIRPKLGAWMLIQSPQWDYPNGSKNSNGA